MLPATKSRGNLVREVDPHLGSEDLRREIRDCFWEDMMVAIHTLGPAFIPLGHHCVALMDTNPAVKASFEPCFGSSIPRPKSDVTIRMLLKQSTFISTSPLAYVLLLFRNIHDQQRCAETLSLIYIVVNMEIFTIMNCYDQNVIKRKAFWANYPPHPYRSI